MLPDRRSEVLAVVAISLRRDSMRDLVLDSPVEVFRGIRSTNSVFGPVQGKLIASLWRAHASITLARLLSGYILFVALVGSRKIKRHRARLVPTPPSIKRRFDHVQDRILHVRFHHTRAKLHRKITLVHSLINQ